jgi:ubiquinone/menaquinone biosynthesis C-methylase UbiE
MFFPDKDKGFREAHRVLVSGGRYLSSLTESQNSISCIYIDDNRKMLY